MNLAFKQELLSMMKCLMDTAKAQTKANLNLANVYARPFSILDRNPQYHSWIKIEATYKQLEIYAQDPLETYKSGKDNDDTNGKHRHS